MADNNGRHSMALEDELRVLIEKRNTGNSARWNKMIAAWTSRNAPTILAALAERKAPVEVEGLVERCEITAGEAGQDPLIVGLHARIEGVVEFQGYGCWRTCTGCYESEDGYPVGDYPHSPVLGCTLGGGCSECGGLGAVWDDTDWEAFARASMAGELDDPEPARNNGIALTRTDGGDQPPVEASGEGE